MPYYVVNAGRGRSAHIMKSNSPSIPGVGTFVVSNIVGFGVERPSKPVRANRHPLRERIHPV
jgi:hypothetical protein